MIDMFELGPHLPANAALLPLGFKQRLALACATLHAPAVLFLDEPTSGVDPLMRRGVWQHINALTTKGVAGAASPPPPRGKGGCSPPPAPPRGGEESPSSPRHGEVPHW